MPKPRGGVFKAAQRDTRYQPMIEKALRYPFGTVHVTPPLSGDAHALDVQRGIYRSARHLEVSAHVDPWERKRNGTVILRFRLFDKQAGKAAVARQVQAGKTLAYNLRRSRDT